jgi:polysaccharide export outer membrane protein
MNETKRTFICAVTFVAVTVSLAAYPTFPQGSSRFDDSNQSMRPTDSSQSKDDEITPLRSRHDNRYKIHASDSVELSFALTPEFNQTVTVQPDGYISLREVGDVAVVGDTLPQLTECIKNAYSKLLHEPLISVNLEDFEKPYFVVGGQVGKPGKFEWRSEITVTQAIETAGGFTEMSKHSKVVLFRRVSDKWTETKVIDVKKMLNSRNLQEDLELRPGDMLYVPKNTISKIKPFIPNSGAGVYYNPTNF